MDDEIRKLKAERDTLRDMRNRDDEKRKLKGEISRLKRPGLYRAMGNLRSAGSSFRSYATKVATAPAPKVAKPKTRVVYRTKPKRAKVVYRTAPARRVIKRIEPKQKSIFEERDDMFRKMGL